MSRGLMGCGCVQGPPISPPLVQGPPGLGAPPDCGLHGHSFHPSMPFALSAPDSSRLNVCMFKSIGFLFSGFGVS